MKKVYEIADREYATHCIALCEGDFGKDKLELLSIDCINEDTIRFCLREVSPNPWKRFEDEKPEEGQLCEFLKEDEWENFCVDVKKYNSKDCPMVKMYNTNKLENATHWRSFTPPSKDEKDNDKFEYWWNKKYEKIMEHTKICSTMYHRLKISAQAAWQAALKEKV